MTSSLPREVSRTLCKQAPRQDFKRAKTAKSKAQCVKLDAGSTVPYLRAPPGEQRGTFPAHRSRARAADAHGCAIGVTESSFTRRIGRFTAKRPTREHNPIGVSAVRHW